MKLKLIPLPLNLIFLSKYRWQIVVLIIIATSVISCSQNDDLDTVINETPDNLESVIIYTDIEQDYTSKTLGDFYNLDLNNDGIVDFLMKSYFDGYEWFDITSTNSINASISVTPWLANVVPLDYGRAIFSDTGVMESYETSALFAVGYCFGGEIGCFYDWKDKNDKYLGLKFSINQNIHYGWARLEVTNATQWVIKDYAYNATPNKPILAGQKE